MGKLLTLLLIRSKDGKILQRNVKRQVTFAISEVKLLIQNRPFVI